MGFSRFGVHLGVRIGGILLMLAVVGYLFVSGTYPTTLLLALVVAAALTVELFRVVAKTNRELSRFLDAARYADFGQRFEFQHVGAGFAELGDTFTDILDRFSDDRSRQEGELHHLKAVLEHVPVPLLSVRMDGGVTVWNNAARRFLGRVSVTRVEDLSQFGEHVPDALMAIVPGDKALLNVRIEDREQALSVAASEISIATRVERLLSLQNIQSELDLHQLQAWQDLVHVLTHEIMNSITPLTSLSQTAVTLIEDMGAKIAEGAEVAGELDDIRSALETVHRRSEGLTQFVTSYRQFTRVPQPRRESFRLTELFAEVERIEGVGFSERGVVLSTDVRPETLTVNADRRMLEQVLINLLNNALQAVQETGGRVHLSAALNAQGRIGVTVADNGNGVSNEVAERMFVPFFTTRKDGTGVGLALSRQIMIAHGGTLTYSPGELGGAVFTLTF